MTVSRSPMVTWAFLCLSFLMGCGTAPEPQESSADETSPTHYRQRLGKLKYQRDKLLLSIDRLEKDRTDILARLRSQGIHSTIDLKSLSNWTVPARELQEIVDTINRLQMTVEQFDAAIVRIESVLRRADREKRIEGSKLTEEKLNELSETFYEVDEQLKSHTDIPGVEEIELESLIKKVSSTHD